MRTLLLILLFILGSFNGFSQIQNPFEDFFKYSTFYTAVNGGNSISDQSVSLSIQDY